MKIVVLGADGYLGWPTCMYLASKGHEIIAVDDYSKRTIEMFLGIKPLLPTNKLLHRNKEFSHNTENCISVQIIDICNFEQMKRLVEIHAPNVIVHYAEQPSAPYSMIGVNETNRTLTRNISSTLSVLYAIKDTNIHLVKLGTMGEYGTPNVSIPEGFFDIADSSGRKDRLLFPKQPGSFYHCSKVADSTLIDFACRTWGVRATELNQGVVYGIDTEETKLDPALNTSFHYDGIFGTVLNRFITQAACSIPLTIHGNGTQTRGYLNIVDTLRCIELACSNTPDRGKMTIMNQFTEQFSILELAEMVMHIEKSASIQMINNPRVEKENHYYRAEHTKLKSLGLKPTYLNEGVLENMLKVVKDNVSLVDKSKIMAEVTWR